MIGLGQTLGNFQARLGLDSKDYARGMINAESASRVFGNTFTAFVSNPLLGSIELFKNVGKAAIRGSQEILANAEAIERLSQQTGASEPLLIAMTKRLEIAGFTAERSRQSFQFLTKFISDLNTQGPLSTQVLEQLGISLDGLTGTDDVFRALIDGISKVEQPALRSAIAARIFGEEAGPQLINAIGGGNAAIDEMIEQYQRLGFVVDRDGNTKLAAMNTNIGLVNQAIDGIKVNFLRELLIGLNGEFDLTNEGIISTAESINGDLTPAARDLAVVLAEVARLLSLIADTIRFFKGIEDRAEASGLFAPGYAVRSFILGERGEDPTSENQVIAQQRNRDRLREQNEEMGL